jgi:hypothetical protein
MKKRRVIFKVSPIKKGKILIKSSIGLVAILNNWISADRPSLMNLTLNLYLFINKEQKLCSQDLEKLEK